MKYIRIYESMSAQELAMIKIAFNKEGIDYRTLFEKTMQTGDIVAMGYRGAILEVVEKDVIYAKEVLFEEGIIIDYNPEKDRFEWIKQLDKITQNIPFIGTVDFSFRLLFIIFLIAVLGFTLLLLSVKN